MSRFVSRSHSRPLFGFRTQKPTPSTCRWVALTVTAFSLLSALPPLSAQETTAPTPSVSIDGTPTDVSPAPVITRAGSVLVPLRGVLEKLGAKITFSPKDGRIDVTQNGKLTVLRVGQKSAVSGGRSIALAAAPQIIGTSTFVPLRSLAELFGYRVEWDNARKTVLVSTSAAPTSFANHRAALTAARRFGVGIDFLNVPKSEIGTLLDRAKQAGVDLVQTRIDWNLVQPVKGKPFDFSFYDEVMKEARARNLIVVGVLGNSAQWASLSRSTLPNEWRNNAPRAKELPSFGLYVERTVAHFSKDVHAWQVWEQPASWKFRAANFGDYRNLVATAIKSARKADANAIIHAAEPGGVNLTFLSGLKADANVSALDGVSLYPASQWQPGLPVPSEDLLLSLNAYRERLQVGRDLWAGGLWWPAIEGEGVALPGGSQFNKVSDERRAEILNTFSAGAQADYLVRTATLGLAGGLDKVFWNQLQDDGEYDVVEPINPEWGVGLLRRDLTPRPSFQAMQTLTRLLGDPSFKYIGALATGPDAVALVFDNGQIGHVVAWSPSGKGKITFGDGEDPQVPGSLWIRTRADSQILDASGSPVTALGSLDLSQRPIWLTQIAVQTAQRAKDTGKEAVKYLQITRPLPRATNKELARATFGENGNEDGLLWRKYQQFRGQATKLEDVDGTPSLVAQTPPDIFRPGDGKPYLFFDVADDLLFFERGVPVTISVKVRRTEEKPGALTRSVSGFKIEYDAPGGTRSTRWQEVEAGEGWAEYSFQIPDASFGNVGGSDFTLNAFGSKQNLFIGEVRLKPGV